MIIPTDYIIQILALALIGLFAIILTVSAGIVATIKLIERSNLRKLNFERSLCPACRNNLYKYKIEQEKD